MAEQEKQQQEPPIFRMQKMYVKDLSFENPNAPGMFLEKNQEPRVDFDLKIKNNKIDEVHYEVSLAITARVVDKKADDKVMFIIEVDHAGIFLLKHIPDEHMPRVLAVDCPLLLFPFTRQIVSQVSVDGGFTPFLMEPINFVALYDNAQKKKQDA